MYSNLMGGSWNKVKYSVVNFHDDDDSAGIVLQTWRVRVWNKANPNYSTGI